MELEEKEKAEKKRRNMKSGTPRVSIYTNNNSKLASGGKRFG